MAYQLRYMLKRAELVAMMGRLVETYPTPTERRKAVLELLHCGAIRETTADMLIEAYGLENA